MTKRQQKFMVDGVEYAAASAESLVAQMNAASFFRRPTDHEFMREVAERTTMQSGDKPRTDTFENFVDDLVVAGMVKEI